MLKNVKIKCGAKIEPVLCLPVPIDPKSGEEVEPSERIILNRLNLILIEDEQADIRVALEISLFDHAEVITGSTEVTNGFREACRDRGQSNLGHVDKLNPGIPEESREQVGNRVRAQDQMSQGGQIGKRGGI